jgi:hypothetical protein
MIEKNNIKLFSHLVLFGNLTKIKVEECSIEEIEFLISINYSFDINLLDTVIEYCSITILEILLKATNLQVIAYLPKLICYRLKNYYDYS